MHKQLALEVLKRDKDRILELIASGHYHHHDVKVLNDVICAIRAIESAHKHEYKHSSVHGEDYIHDMHDSHETELDWLFKTVKNELTSTERYYHKWTKSQNAKHKAKAKEELGHAQEFIAELKALPGAQTEAAKISELETWFSNLQHKLQ